jgi:peptidoglycan-associated lipoprotein
MNLVSKKFFLVAASAALVLAGCTKKPTRPAPDQTILGGQPGGGGPSMNSAITDASLSGAPEGLTNRPEGFNEQNQNRTALQAYTVYFDFDSSAIKPSEREKLKAVKDYLDKNPGYKILLEGHCDWRGTAEYNLSLGDRRASATKKFLQTLGASADKLDTLSKGSLEASRNADAATMVKDRRVDIVVVNPAGAPVTPATGGLAPL